MKRGDPRTALQQAAVAIVTVEQHREGVAVGIDLGVLKEPCSATLRCSEAVAGTVRVEVQGLSRKRHTGAAELLARAGTSGQEAGDSLLAAGLYKSSQLRQAG